jgi:chromosomal replication initiator protein
MLYKEVLLLLKDEISHKEYERYIQYLKYDEKSSKSDLHVFIAKNPLISRWINTKYSHLISHFFEIKTGIKPKILIRSNSSPTSNISKKIEDCGDIKTQTVLNPIYTFESFVVGSSNQMAYALCESVAKKPASEYNPLFIYGLSGLGKTHMLQAIGNQAIKNSKNVIYTTSEQFMNDFTYNLRNKTPDRFRAKYRECDYLLIDDIQFLSQKEQTQEEFFHTFNELHSSNKQIVLTSDKPPKKIVGFEDRLRSRFEWGMLVSVQPPHLETKISIIQKKCELNGIVIESDIVNYIATNMGENIREIESAITSIYSYSTLMAQDITLEFVKNILKDQIKAEKENITLEQIIKVISMELNIKPSDIKSKKRNKAIVKARRIVIFLARELTPNSTPALAGYFSMKDHTAISHNIKKINQILDEDENFKVKVDELKNKILTLN